MRRTTALSNSRAANVAPNLPDNGEVYRTAERLREASAVALAAGLYVAGEQDNRRYPQSADSVIAGVRSARLLPPGVTVDARAMLLSPFSTELLRFRSDLTAFEVIDIPHSREDGPALMVRIPGSGPDGERGSVFIADRLGDIDLPGPFASISVLHYIEQYDAVHGIPRPMDAPHLTAYHRRRNAWPRSLWVAFGLSSLDHR